MEWESTVRKLMLAETSDLIELARIAERDPKTFYIDANLRDAKLTVEEYQALGLPSPQATLQTAEDLDHAGLSLADKIALQRVVLEGYDTDSSPQSWARAQIDLGILLHRLGMDFRTAKPIHNAVDAFGAALEIQSKWLNPKQWASTTVLRADAHADIGRLTGVRNALREAVKDYSLALSVQTLADAPIHWATTSSRLGMALLEFVNPSDLPMLEEAVDILKAVRSFWIEQADQRQINVADYELGLARLNLGRAGSIGELQKARNTFERVLATETSVLKSALFWALGETQLAIGERGNRAALNKALDALMSASELQWQEGAPEAWAQTRALTARAYRIMGNFGSAEEAIEDALTILTAERYPKDYAAAIRLKKECQSKGGE